MNSSIVSSKVAFGSERTVAMRWSVLAFVLGPCSAFLSTGISVGLLSPVPPEEGKKKLQEYLLQNTTAGSC